MCTALTLVAPSLLLLSALSLVEWPERLVRRAAACAECADCKAGRWQISCLSLSCNHAHCAHRAMAHSHTAVERTRHPKPHNTRKVTSCLYGMNSRVETFQTTAHNQSSCSPSAESLSLSVNNECRGVRLPPLTVCSLWAGARTWALVAGRLSRGCDAERCVLLLLLVVAVSMLVGVGCGV